MFIAARAIRQSAPFGGAGFRWRFTTQDHSASERSRSALGSLDYRHLTPSGVKPIHCCGLRLTQLLHVSSEDWPPALLCEIRFPLTAFYH